MNLRGVTTMRDYYAPDWWYEPDCDVSPYDDYVHVDDLPDLDHARDHMKAVLEALYGNGSLENLESSLEEVLSILEMKLPTVNLCVRKEAM